MLSDKRLALIGDLVADNLNEEAGPVKVLHLSSIPCCVLTIAGRSRCRQCTRICSQSTLSPHLPS